MTEPVFSFGDVPINIPPVVDTRVIPPNDPRGKDQPNYRMHRQWLHYFAKQSQLTQNLVNQVNILQNNIAGIVANLGDEDFSDIFDVPVAPGGLKDGDYGDISISNGGTGINIDNSAVTNAKLANMAAGTIKSNVTGGAAAPSDNLITAILDLLGSTKGDILVRDTSAWTVLAAGATAGHTLTSNGAGALPSYQAGGTAGLVKISSAAVAGSAATTLTLSSLDLSAYRAWIIPFYMDNATGSAASVSLYFNSDTTATNYREQALTGNGASASAARANDGIVWGLTANETSTGFLVILKDLDGKARTLAFVNRGAPASIITQLVFHVWDSATNVTGITWSSSVANSLAIGSGFTVYGLIL